MAGRILRTAVLVLFWLVTGVSAVAADAGPWVWPLDGPHEVSGLRPTRLPLRHRAPRRRPARGCRPGRARSRRRPGLLRRTHCRRGVVVIVHGELRTTYEPVTAVVAVDDVVEAGQSIGTLQGGHLGCPFDACLHWGSSGARTIWTRSAWSNASPPGCCRWGPDLRRPRQGPPAPRSRCLARPPGPHRTSGAPRSPRSHPGLPTPTHGHCDGPVKRPSRPRRYWPASACCADLVRRRLRRRPRPRASRRCRHPRRLDPCPRSSTWQPSGCAAADEDAMQDAPHVGVQVAAADAETTR